MEDSSWNSLSLPVEMWQVREEVHVTKKVEILNPNC